MEVRPVLDGLRCHTTIPARDLDRAKAWYRDTLGLEAYEENEQGVWYRCGDGSIFALYPSQFAGAAQHTVMGWASKDLHTDVGALRDRGVAFEEYDLPGIKTEGGIAEFGPYRAAWFKDGDGNILMVYEG
jgi:catechol 2,3-dioxygenase-like lactoylglutathione lyase family enzyme